MPYYRLYYLTEDHIRQVVEIVCETDEEAIATVEKHRDGRAMQLWQEARCVRRFEATAPAPADGGKKKARRARAPAGLAEGE